MAGPGQAGARAGPEVHISAGVGQTKGKERKEESPGEGPSVLTLVAGEWPLAPPGPDQAEDGTELSCLGWRPGLQASAGGEEVASPPPGQLALFPRGGLGDGARWDHVQEVFALAVHGRG